MTERIAISAFEPQYAPAFQTLNEEWIHNLFEMEEADRKVLVDPKTAIIDKGGEILFAIDTETGEVVGTCALLDCGDGLCELAKMAVTPNLRGYGIGQKLGDAFMSTAAQRKFSRVFLETNSSLAPAIALYRSLGFVQLPFPYDSDYSRADVYMEAVIEPATD